MSSIHDLVRPGAPLDLYYYSSETLRNQAFPTTQNTKYKVNFSNTGAGTSSFLFSPQQGLQDIVVTMQFSGLPSGTANLTNLALPSGWGYALIKSCAFRYGASSQFVISGDQLLQNAMRDQTSRTSCDDILNIGGNYASGLDLINTQTASVVLRLPHSSCSGPNKQFPLPTDCLTQNCQILLEINPPAAIWTNRTGAALPAQCVALNQGYFQCQQIMFNNAGDSLSRRVDLSSSAYAFPCQFTQQKQVINLHNSTNPQPVTISGFRAGNVTSIQCWLSNLDDLQTSSNGATVNAYNPNKFYAPVSVEMLYAGDVYALYNNGVGQLFNLINSNKASAFDMAQINPGPPGVAPLDAPTAFLSQWLELPFAQPLCDEDSHFIYVNGKVVTNGIINLNNLVIPYASVNGWQLNISVIYSATLLFSQGSTDYIF